MTRAENKTKATDVSVDDFIAAVADSSQRADAENIRAMMEKLSGEPPKCGARRSSDSAVITTDMKADVRAICVVSAFHRAKGSPTAQ